MRLPLLILFFVLLTASQASADFNNVLGIYGLPKDAVNTEFKQISGYSFTEPGSAIVQVWHTSSYGTTVTENYNLQGYRITAKYTCKNSWLTTTCDFHVSGGGQSSDTNTSWISMGLLGTVDIDTSIVNDQNGTVWFGVGRHALFDNYFGMADPAQITFPALKSSPITSMTGQASSLIDITVQTLTIDEYSNYANGMLNQSERDAATQDTIKGIQSSVIGIIGIVTMFTDHPILVFAYLEIFALMIAMNSKDMVGWWKRYLGIHLDVIEFLLNNYQAVIASLTIVLTVGGLVNILTSLTGG